MQLEHFSTSFSCPIHKYSIFFLLPLYNFPMAATDSKQIAFEFPPFFRLYSDSTIDRLLPVRSTPPSDHPNSTVRSKDVIISPETGVSVRIFAPGATPAHKLPVVVYIHGGAFCIGSASDPAYHDFLSGVVEKANVIAVSIDYRLAPENPLPIAFDDSWAAIQWIASHSSTSGPEPWLNEYADLGKVFVGGESAGATIAHDMAIRAGDREILIGNPNFEILGIFLVHPFFGGKEVATLYKLLCPASSARDDDPRLNPAVDARIGSMAGRRVVFFLAEKDFLKERGVAYCEGLKKSAWVGEVEVFESEGEEHCFHLFNSNSDKARALTDRLVEWLKVA